MTTKGIIKGLTKPGSSYQNLYFTTTVTPHSYLITTGLYSDGTATVDWRSTGVLDAIEIEKILDYCKKHDLSAPSFIIYGSNSWERSPKAGKIQLTSENLEVIAKAKLTKSRREEKERSFIDRNKKERQARALLQDLSSKNAIEMAENLSVAQAINILKKNGLKVVTVAENK